MPSRCFGHNSEYEMIQARKDKDNRRKKMNYWRENYGLEVTDDQYELFSQYSTKIRHIIPILDFVKTLNYRQTGDT
jgi:hypothetical protein